MIKIFVVAMTLIMVGFWGSVGILIYGCLRDFEVERLKTCRLHLQGGGIFSHPL